MVMINLIIYKAKILCWKKLKKIIILNTTMIKPRMERHQGTYYLRLNALDRAGSMAEITKAIAEANVSIERIVQRKDPASAAEGRLPVVFITHETDEATMRKAMVWLSEHEAIAGTPVMIRIENE